MMNARYKIHPEEGYVESWLQGSITPSEMLAHSQRVWSDPGWKAELNGLMDLSDATFEFTDAEFRALINMMLADPRCSLARWAFIVTKASTFAMLRKLDVLTREQSTIRIFFSRGDAEKWLFQPQARDTNAR